MPRGKKQFRRSQSHYYGAHTAGFQTIWKSSCGRVLSGKPALLMEMHVFFLSKILKDSLLTNRLNQALSSLIGLSGRCDTVPELFCMAGLEILKNIPSSHMLCIQFYKNMFLACPDQQQEILLNFALYLVLRQQDVTEGLELLKSKSGKVDFNNNYLHKAYIGLFEYIHWQPRQAVGNMNNHLKQDNIAVSDDEHDGECDEKDVKPMVDFSAEHAINLFEEVFSTTGIWDVFVPANLHLLKHCKGVSHARRFLEMYRDKNELNPNAHRYLYHFLKLNNGSDKDLLNVLEDLIKLDSTSELLGDLINLRIKSGAKGNIIQLMFQKLDHAGCMFNEETWKMLESYLRASMKGEDDANIRKDVHLAWKERESWWPQYHFRIPRNFDISGNSAVMLAKANVAEYFLGENNFSNEVRLCCRVDRMVTSTANEGDDCSTSGRMDRKRQIIDTDNEILQVKRKKH